MIVIRSTQKTMEMVGLLFTSSEKQTYKIYRWISFAILSVLFEPSCLYLVENYRYLIKATEVCIYIAAEGVMMVKAIFMFYNRKLIIRVLEDLQRMANEKIRSGRTAFLFKLDKESELICKSFLIMLAIAICFWSGGPVVAIIYRKIQGTYVPHMYGHSYKAIWPFDYKTTPGYEMIYVVNVIYNIYLAVYFAACDLFFVSCGLHLIGATQDLEHFFLEIDKEVDVIIAHEETRSQEKMMVKHQYPQTTSQFSLNIGVKLKEAVRIHYKIIQISHNLVTIEQGIIFSQFFGVLFSLSAIAFQVVISTAEQQLFYIGPTVVILCQLFLYCYFGQRITDEAFRLSESIYQLNWYNYPAKYQKYFQIMILRCQNSSYFSGFGFVSCSLQSFTDVLKFVGSVVTLFRNLQD